MLSLALFGMNYGGGGSISLSGEAWVITHVIKRELDNVAHPVIFDVGANVGDYSLCILSNLPAAKIYAFEPSAPTFASLAKVAAGSNNRIEAVNQGFSDRQKIATLYSYTFNGEQASVLTSLELRLATQEGEILTDSTESIELTTIDDFCEQNKLDTVHFLKIDVEGHELAVLNGAQRMSKAGRIPLIQFEFGPANIYSRTFFYDFWSLLSEGYRIYRIIPHGLVEIERYIEQREVFLTTNYLAMHR
jgi:FkbM family methyltransferase